MKTEFSSVSTMFNHVVGLFIWLKLENKPKITETSNQLTIHPYLPPSINFDTGLFSIYTIRSKELDKTCTKHDTIRLKKHILAPSAYVQI